MGQLTIIILAVAAVVTATISGILGMGGGITLLTAMFILFPLEQVGMVIPIHGIVQLSSNSTRTLAFLKHVDWKIFAIYSPPMIGGVWAAKYVWEVILEGDGKLDWFKPFIGLFVLVFLIWRRFKPKLRTPPEWWYAPLGLVVGFLTIFVGATGPFIAPFFLRDDFKKENTIATKAVCQAWGHLLKIPVFLSLGFDFEPYVLMLVLMVAGVIVGTFIGKAILARMGQRTFVRLFELVLGSMALWLILNWLGQGQGWWSSFR